MENLNGIEKIRLQKAFNERISTFKYKNLTHKDFTSFFNAVEKIFITQSKEFLSRFNCLKANCTLEVVFRKIIPAAFLTENDDDDNEDIVGPPEIKYFQSDMHEMMRTNDLSVWFKENIVNRLMAQIDRFEESGSGWTLDQISSMDAQFNKCKKFSTSGSSYIKLPPSILKKFACINVKNKDNRCFMWAILSALHNDDPTGQKTNNVTRYKRFINELNFDGIDFPVKVCDIDRFEQLNPDISVNIYFYQREYNPFRDVYMNVVQPLRIATNIAENHIHLLLLWQYKNDTATVEREEGWGRDENEPVFTDEIYDNVDNTIKTHYVWIKNLSALVQAQTTRNRSKKYICDRCLHCFTTKEKLYAHIVYCEHQNHIRRIMPPKAKAFVRFQNFKNQIRMPFIVYADIESLLKPIEEEEAENTSSIGARKFPKGAKRKHIPCSIGYYFLSITEPHLSRYEAIVGPDCIEKFIDRLIEIMRDIV